MVDGSIHLGKVEMEKRVVHMQRVPAAKAKKLKRKEEHLFVRRKREKQKKAGD